VLFSYPLAFIHWQYQIQRDGNIPTGTLLMGKSRMAGLSDCRNILRICSAVSTEYRRVADGQTSCHGIVRAMHTRRAVKTTWNLDVINKVHWCVAIVVIVYCDKLYPTVETCWLHRRSSGHRFQSHWSKIVILPQLWGTRLNVVMTLGMEKLDCCGYPMMTTRGQSNLTKSASRGGAFPG